MGKEIITTATPVDLVATVKKWLNVTGKTKTFTPEEQETFIEIAMASQLNPFKNEIHAVKYKDKPSFITGFEVYLKRAERSGKLDGWKLEHAGDVAVKSGERGYYVDRSNSTLTATVTIWRKDWSHPFTHTVSIKEFCGSSPIWVSSTRYMLGKTAISQGFRMAFPDEIGSLPITEFEQSSEALDGGQPNNGWMVERANALKDTKQDVEEAAAIAATIAQFVEMNEGEAAYKYLLSLEKLPEKILGYNVVEAAPSATAPTPIEEMTPDQIDAAIERGLHSEYSNDIARNAAEAKYGDDRANFLKHLREKRDKRLAKSAKKPKPDTQEAVND